MNAKRFGNSLKEIRKKEKKMTLVDLEEETGFSNGYLSMIENGHKGIPPLETLKKLANGLDIPITRIMDIAGYSEISDQMKKMARTAKSVNEASQEQIDRINENGDVINPEAFPDPSTITRQLNVPIEYILDGKKKEFNNDDILNLYNFISLAIDRNDLFPLTNKNDEHINVDELKKILPIIESLFN